MAVTSRPKTTDHHLPLSNKWKPREELSPERTKVWSEPTPKLKSQRKVPVVYYLSRDGHLQQPHFMEVPLSSPEGLYLKDVINRLNSLRGKGMASMYSWSSKRSYKHGFVWQDLSENDFIYPCHGLEYVLKGSELVEGCAKSPEEGIHRSGEESKESDSPVVVIRRRNQSWSAVDLHEYKVYKSEATGEFAGKAADAATQTDDKGRGRRRQSIQEEEEKIELNREEISPPPSSSSSETLETLIKSEGSNINVSRGGNESDEKDHMGRMKASTVLMQLISCGSFSVKECGSRRVRGLPVISEYGGVGNQMGKELGVRDDNTIFGGVEDKEYFSGSLIETRKKDFGGLKRSASYNADRSLKMDLKDKEIDGVRARCMPRKPKNLPPKKEPSNTTDMGSSNTGMHGSKRYGEEATKSKNDAVVVP